MTDSRGIGNHQRPHRGASDEWYTPPEIFEALKIDFDLDPCSPPQGPVSWIPARRFLSLEQHGLLSSWDPSERVWLNPPYGPETGVWLSKLAAHGNGVALTFARTDTRWFQQFGSQANALCFVAGRPHFYRPDGTRAPYNCGAPVVLMGYGAECSAAVRRCGLGTVLVHEAAA